MTTAYFDRFDICAAYNLYLQHHHTGQASRAYARLSKLRKHYTPSRSKEHISGLSENALEIYVGACARAGTLNRIEHPIANTPMDGSELFLMWAGTATNSGLLGVQVYVWADSFDDAFEELVEYLDDHAPGCLVSHADAEEALEDYCQEHGICLDGEDEDAWCAAHEAVELANDWTSIGHTSLKHGNHIASHEWGGDEVPDQSDDVRLASTDAYAEHFQAVDRAEAVAACAETLAKYAPGTRWALSPTGQVAEYWTQAARALRHDALITLFCLTGGQTT